MTGDEGRITSESIQQFTLQEIDDIIRNNKNLLYMFYLNGDINELLPAT